MRPYEHLREDAPAEARDMLDRIREFCLGLGDTVVEDVRAHRMVYGKSMIYRWFADIEPQESHLVVKTQRSRREGPCHITIQYDGDAAPAMNQIREAFEAVR